MVNLGWVPFENRMEITKDSEPLGRMDFEEIDFGGANEFFDPYSNWWYKKQYDEDTEEEYPFTDVTGIVRRSETMNPMIGNTNIPSQWHFQYIDTSYMKMLFQMKNDVDFDDHYLERFVEDLEDDDSFPVPATRNNFQVSTGTPDLYSRYARNSSLVSAVSFAGLAALMLL